MRHTVRASGKRRFGKRAGWVLGLAVLPIVLAACGSSGDAKNTASKVADNWDAIVKAAKKEGSVTVYTSAGGSDEAFKAFNQEYPDIKLTTVREPTADLLTRLDQELEVSAAGADVAYHSQPAWFVDRGKEGKLANIKYGPAAKGWPSDAMMKKYTTIVTVPFETVWNTKKGQPIENVGDFLDNVDDKTPIGLLDPASSVAATSQFQAWIDAFGDDFLEKLAKKNVVIEGSTVPLTQKIASGELTYGFPIPAGVVTPLIASGAPIGHTVPAEGSVGYNYSAGVLANAPHPNAAMVFMNWLMEKKTLELILKEVSTGGATPVTVPGSSDRSKIPVYKVEDWPQSRWDKFVQNFNKVFKR